MITKKENFPVKGYGDNIVIERIHILTVPQKRAAKSKITIEQGLPPKNMMELEKQKMQEMAQYNDAEDALMKTWDEHPNQGIVVAVGPGRDMGNGVFLAPAVKIGQHVLVRGKSGDPLIVCKKLYWVIKDYDLFCTVPAASLIK